MGTRALMPKSASEVSAEWLTEVLRNSGKLDIKAKVSNVAVEAGSAGVGFMGEVARLTLDYSERSPDLAETMICKFPTQQEQVKAMLRPTRIYEREHRFYLDLAGLSPLRTPFVYHVTCNTSIDEMVEEEYVLLMEDFSDLTLGDQVVGVSPDRAGVVLSDLAAHHAFFWNERGLSKAEFVPSINGSLNKAVQNLYFDAMPVFEEIFGSVLLPEMIEISRSYGSNHPQLLDQLAALPQTLCHGDFRADNLFFDSDGSVAVIDWQGISRCGAAADVGYFLSQNMDLDDRRDHESELLRVYHESLVNAGVSDYEFSRFFEDYKLGILYGWIIPVFAVGSLDVSSERAMELWNRVLIRSQDAILQHGAQKYFD